jgi:hypothetical protein
MDLARQAERAIGGDARGEAPFRLMLFEHRWQRRKLLIERVVRIAANSGSLASLLDHHLAQKLANVGLHR